MVIVVRTIVDGDGAGIVPKRANTGHRPEIITAVNTNARCITEAGRVLDHRAGIADHQTVSMAGVADVQGIILIAPDGTGISDERRVAVAAAGDRGVPDVAAQTIKHHTAVADDERIAAAAVS